MTKQEILELISNMQPNEVIRIGRVTVSKEIDFIEGNHGMGNLKYTYYKWLLEIGNEEDADYDWEINSCHNDSSINECVNTIFNKQ